MKSTDVAMVLDNMSSIRQAEAFTREILPQVSRTFDLAIKFLPGNLGKPVGLAYLLCRIADTFEDSPSLTPPRRREFLQKYASLLGDQSDGDRLLSELQNAFASHNGASANQTRDDLPTISLVENAGKVLAMVRTLPSNYQNHILPRVREMALGMASYTTLASGQPSQVEFLENEDDWNRYCYYVAGTVGHMLTDIFSDYVRFPDQTRDRLHVLGRSFGLGLQKVNILKDAVSDTRRGICFLPRTIIDRFGISFDRKTGGDVKGDIGGLIHRVIEICRDHFQDSLEYIRAVPRKFLGLRMFLIVPLMLAAGTLRLFADYPNRLLERGDLKLARSEVFRLVRKSSLCKFSNHLLAYSFGRIYPT